MDSGLTALKGSAMEALEELILKLSVAVGHDRGIDADIWTIETRREYPDPNDPDILWDVHARIVARLKSGGDDPECPRYTASIDSARTLVPEGWLVDFIGQGPTKNWCAQLYKMDGPGMVASGEGLQTFRPTAPLAICIASLRARLAEHLKAPTRRPLAQEPNPMTPKQEGEG